MDYSKLITRNMPAAVTTPEAAAADTDYVFSVTYTDPDTMPTAGIAEAVRIAMINEGQDLARYPPPLGHPGLREYIADSLRTNRGADVPVDQIFLSAGAGGAIGTVLEAFLDPGDTVLVEEFSYLGTLSMFLSRRANVVHVRTDDEGMDTAALEASIRDLVRRGIQPKMIYTISVYQNPMGVTLSADRRRRMIEISQKYGVPIFENESYADFRIDGDPLPPAMLGTDDQDSVIYTSAYTKLLGCGLRLGFGVVPEPMLATMKALRFGTSPSHLAAQAVYGFLCDHGDSHIEAVSESLKVKRDAMLAALGENFGSAASWDRPDGALYVWVKLREDADLTATHALALDADVGYQPGVNFAPDGVSGKNYARLCYGYNTSEEIHEGIARLAEVFHKASYLQG